MFSLTELRALLSSDGQKFIVGIVQRAKEKRGAKWMEFIKENYPNAVWMIDLVANKTAEAALAELKTEYPLLRLASDEQNQSIKNLHAKIKVEIERKR